MLFIELMDRRTIYIFSGLVIIIVFGGLLLNSDDQTQGNTEKIKIAMRDVGHQLLLSHQDSTSLVLPVIKINKSTYELSFQKDVSFMPNDLVSILKKNFQKSGLPEYYRVEVIQCADNEVAYSYQISANKENTIIPCAGRQFPENCYLIFVHFTSVTASYSNKTLYFILALSGFLLIVLGFVKRKPIKMPHDNNEQYTTIGSFQFYPEQNKLVKKAKEISLSKKECELLEIFVAHPNQIIKRDELMKKVWEDNGVFVGRSLDTYISKLRKKLKDDTSIKITNVHGVGYKLEVT